MLVLDRGHDRNLVLVHVNEEVRVQRIEEAAAQWTIEEPEELDRDGKEVEVGLNRLDASFKSVVGAAKLFLDSPSLKAEVS